MNKSERLDAIAARIRQGVDASVAGLSAATGVSEVTIRKDLQQLEREGRIRRSYGKLFPAETVAEDAAAVCESAAKTRIGRLAAELVRDEDLIFIGPGYTGVELARALKGHRRLSVITMNISAAMALSDAPEIRLLTLPGDFTRRNGTYYVTGTPAMEYARELYADKVFVTADGFDPDRGFSVLDEITANIYRALIKPGTQVYVFVTRGRFSRNARAALGPLGLARAVVTDSRPDAPCLTALEAQNVQIYYPQED